MSSLPHYSEFKTDLWRYLATQDKPVVMYGMGNGADKIIAVFEKYGIEVADFFASDGFVRGQMFHGKTVLSFSAIKEKYKDFIVIVSFGTSLPDVLNNIYSIAENHELYAPDVPVTGDTLFTLDFYRDNFERFEKTFALLADEISKEIYSNIIRFKITGNISYLKEATSSSDCEKEILDFDKYERFIDAGAYNGDTVRKFIANCKNAKSAIALEPDRRNWKKLCEYAQSEQNIKIYPFNRGAWNKFEKIEFSVCGSRNSSAGKQKRVKTEEVEMWPIDIMECYNIDYIKYDVEGAEKEAILGSVKTIKASTPDMLISLYHRSEDMFALPLLVNELFPEYSLYLRRFEYIPAWDINLYAIKRR